MDQISSVGKPCDGKNVINISNEKSEWNNDWSTPKYRDTAISENKRVRKVFTFYKMETDEISDRYIAPCFVNGLEAYDGEINLGNEENMISNEFAVKLCLDYEERLEKKTQFDLKPHMQSELRPDIRKGIDQHLGKIYTDNKSSLKRGYWVKNLDDKTYDVEAIKSRCLVNISVEDWDEQIRFWSDLKNMTRCAQNARNQTKSTVVCRQGSRTLAAVRDKQMQSSATQEYPSLIQTFFDMHTVGGVFLRDEDRRLYEDMLRLQGLSTYTHDQIMAMVRGGKQRGHIPGVAQKKQQAAPEQIDMITRAMSSDDRYSQLFTQLQSQHESGSGSGSGAAGDHESGNDEDADEDEEDADS
ncbi:hypothetical protein Tco_0369873 [Tanacetum coccineum]